MIHKEANQEMEDRQLKNAVNRRNEIENTIYSTRIKMQDELANYIQNDEKNALPPLMDEVENWLYSGDEAVYDKNILESKSSKLVELTNKIYGRFNAWKNLEEALVFLDNYTQENVNKVNQLCESNMKDFINSEEMFNLIFNSNKQLNDLKEQMNKFPKSMDPPTTAEKLKKQYDELNQVIFLFFRKFILFILYLYFKLKLI